MPTIKIRRLPPLRGRENEAVGHLDEDPRKSHIHAPSNCRNATLSYTRNSNGTDTLDFSGASNITIEGH